MGIKSTCFLAGDSALAAISSPNPSIFPLNVDLDGDAVKDSCSWCSIYNGASPRHSRGIVFLFADGSAKKVPLLMFLGNDGDMWYP